MHGVFIIAVVFGSIVLALAIVCGTILMAMKQRDGGISAKSKQQQAEEAKMIQDIYHGISKMEERVETLETILMDRHGKE
ncbi:phage-shock protein [Thermodesulfobacteriota bacterium]